MDCEEQRKAFKECFMVKTDCRKELDNIFKCTYEKNYYFPIKPPKPMPTVKLAINTSMV